MTALKNTAIILLGGDIDNVKKSNISHVKINNKAVILNSLRAGAVSRADIVKLTGLSKAAVTLMINDFIAEGQIVEKGAEHPVGVGRPPVVIELVPDYRYVAGFSLHRKTISVCIVNLKSELIDNFSAPTSDFSSPAAAIDFLFDQLILLIKVNDIPAERIAGIGVSCPGPLDYRSGLILTPSELELFNFFNIKSYLSAKTSLPVFLDNNSVLLAISEDQLRGNSFESYLFVVVADGIGSAIVSGQEIYRGSSGHSGELGHMTINMNGAVCPCGNRGCLERYVSMAALKEKFGFIHYPAVVDRACAGDDDALSIINYIADAFSAALVSAANLIDLDAIILHGEFNYRQELLFGRMQELVNSHALIANAHPIKIVSSLLQKDSIITCSTAAILKAYFEQRL